MTKRIASLVTALAMVFGAGQTMVHAADPAPVPVITGILTDSVINPTESTFEFQVEIQGTDLSDQVAVFLNKEGDPAPTSTANRLNLGNINAEKTSGNVNGVGPSPESTTTYIVYTSVDNAQTWVASSTKITVNPAPIAVKLISPSGGAMVKSGEVLTAEVKGSNLNSSIQFRGSWNGSAVASLTSINPNKTMGVFTLQLPTNETSKAMKYSLQYKVGSQDWTGKQDILLLTKNYVVGIQFDKSAFPSSGGNTTAKATVKGMGSIKAVRFFLLDRNGNNVIAPIEVSVAPNDEEAYTASASVLVPANTDSTAKTYFLGYSIQSNWSGIPFWTGMQKKEAVTVAGQAPATTASSTPVTGSTPSTPTTTPGRDESTYTANVISKANPSTMAVDIQNILARGDEAQKSKPMPLAELSADNKKVQVNVIPKNLPANVSSEQIQIVLNAVGSVNFSKTPAEAKQVIDQATQGAGAQALYVNFAVPQHVEFGFPVQVTVPTSFAKGTNCFLYYWNDAKKTYEQVDSFTIDENGNATFSITHCSDYFIADKRLGAAGTGTSQPTANVAATANPKTGSVAPYAVIVLALAGCSVLIRSRRKR